MLWFSPRNVGPLDRGNTHAREVGSVLFVQMVGWIDASWGWGPVLGLGCLNVSACGEHGVAHGLSGCSVLVVEFNPR